MSLHTLEVGKHRLKCPACGKPAASDKTFGVTVDHTGYVAQCFRCGHVEYVREQHQRHHAAAYRPPPKPEPKPLSDYWREVWHRTEPITAASIAGRYLTARRCVIPPEDETHLRWTPSLKHPSGYSGPAMVALLTDALTAEPRSIHRTWIRPDGQKADIEGWCRTNGIEAECVEPRLLAKGQDKVGSVCRLFTGEWEQVATRLGIGEGIETALSLAHARLLPWAAVDAGNLSQIPVIPGISRLFIARDRDPAGEKAAKELALRWHAAGREVYISDQTANDINDLLKQAGGIQ